MVQNEHNNQDFKEIKVHIIYVNLKAYSHIGVKTSRRLPATNKMRQSFATTGDQIPPIPKNFLFGSYSPTSFQPFADWLQTVFLGPLATV